MSKELISSIDIAAPASVVWDVLVDLEAYASWNPFITSAEGPLRVGGRLVLRMQPADGAAVTLRPSVVEIVEGHRLRWRGRLMIRGLFDADHQFTVDPMGPRGSRLVQQEQFSGALVPLFRGPLDRGTLPAFHAMNQALKARAERTSAKSEGETCSTP
ncbi:MAG TPA: SRPBCC domain-containing protein [Microlunatus sp.]